MTPNVHCWDHCVFMNISRHIYKADTRMCSNQPPLMHTSLNAAEAMWNLLYLLFMTTLRGDKSDYVNPCKPPRKIIVNHGTNCSYWDQVSLSNTNLCMTWNFQRDMYILLIYKPCCGDGLVGWALVFTDRWLGTGSEGHKFESGWHQRTDGFLFEWECFLKSPWTPTLNTMIDGCSCWVKSIE